jgi:hypothetical protein
MDTTHGYLCPQINGGLGNQLFKLGAAITLAREFNRDLVISKSHFIPNSHQSPVKTIQTLEKLFTQLSSSSKSKSKSASEPTLNLTFLDGDIPGGYHTYKAGSTESFQYVDLKTRIPASILSNKGFIMLDGYFINPRYLPTDYPDLISITPSRPIPDIALEYGDLSQTYFIHIRLGDYVGHELYRIPLDAYYRDCIGRIKTTNPAAKFLICTNEYSRRLEHYLEQIRQITDFMVQSPTDDELDTLFIMSQCRGGICSNSTLSWLGCYFQSSQSQVDSAEHRFMPYPWVNRTWHGFTDDNTRDIYPVWASVYNTQTSKFHDTIFQ